MSAPRIARCVECDRPVAVYGDDETDLVCAACADREPAASPGAAGPVAAAAPGAEA